MHIGLSRPPTPPHPIPDLDGAFVAQIAERFGFESLFYGEHPITPVDDPGKLVHSSGVPFFQDTLVMLARASAVTSRLKLGAAVFLIPIHQPVLFAKQLASLDFYSGGRLIVGAGFGWSRVETEVMGGNFDRRWAQAREAVQLMRKLWADDVAEFHGEFFSVPPVRLFPKPAQTPWPPVLLSSPADGGVSVDSDKAARAFRRIVTYADGWLPAFIGKARMRAGVAEIKKGRKMLEGLCAEAGRDPAELQICALLRTEIHDGSVGWPEVPDREILRMYEDVGVERVIVTIPTLIDEKQAEGVLARLAEELL
jgi:probable F420-dependent oxidoreductase